MIKIIIDTSAWIEYLEDSPRGNQVASFLESNNFEIFVPSAVIAEVVNIALRKYKNESIAMNAMQSLAAIIPLTTEIAFVAGKLYAEHHSKKNSFGMIDAFILATAKTIGAKVLTFDNDFRGFKETIIPNK